MFDRRDALSIIAMPAAVSVLLGGLASDLVRSGSHPGGISYLENLGVESLEMAQLAQASLPAERIFELRERARDLIPAHSLNQTSLENLIADDFRADRVQAIEGVLFAEIEVGLFLLIAQRLF